jgi:hypothetical protein
MTDPTCHHGIDGGCFICTAGDTLQDMNERLLRSEQLNAELAQMLKANEWHGGPSDKECPQCEGSWDLQGHLPDCALDALLKKARTA